MVFHAGYNSEIGYPSSVPLKTEREYFTEMKKWREWQGQNGRSFHLTFIPSNTDRVVERIRASKRKAPGDKTTVEQDHYFVLAAQGYNLLKYTSRGYRYSFSQTGGKQFMTEKSAEKYRQQLLKNHRHNAEIWMVKRVDRATTFRV